MKHPDRQRAIRHLRRLLDRVRGEMQRAEKYHRVLLSRIPVPRRDGARRLLDDAVIRRLGRERLEALIRECGFPFVFSDRGDARRDLEAIAFLLLLQSGEADPVRWDHPREQGLRDAAAERREAAETILGPRRGPRVTRIMVTLAPDAAETPGMLRTWCASGMDAARINCARDSSPVWKNLIGAVRREAARRRRPCAVFMDLGGSKLRTGPIPDEPPVVKIHPVRNRLGTLLHPARVSFVPSGSRTAATQDAGASLPVEGTTLEVLAVGARLRFRDVRGLHRTMRVLESSPSRLTCACRRTAYLVPGSVIVFSRKGKKQRKSVRLRIAPFPGREGGLLLSKGARILLVPRPGATDQQRNRLPSVSLSSAVDPSVIPVGAKVLFDDGKFEGRVASAGSRGLEIEITFAAGDARLLRGDRGVSFPGVDLGLPPMTRKDRQDLRFAARHADMIALSFITAGKDIALLRRALRAERARNLPIIVKIENARALESLDEILLAALRYGPAAVLIARGDLAMECGFVLLPELQREILRRSHVAGLPVIWATGVMENLSRRGIPTRSELTDADVAGEAECVLLNRGDYVAESVVLLHQLYAKRSRRRFISPRSSRSVEAGHAT